MLRRLVTASLALAAAGCAGTQGGQAQPQYRESSGKVANQSYLDVATCAAEPRALPTPYNDAILVGGLVGSRAQVLECLVDPAARTDPGEAAETTVKVTANVTETGGDYTVTGTNLSPQGQECVKGAVARSLPLEPLTKGAQPVKGEAEFQHNTRSLPAVVNGINELSDLAGKIRLASAQWCDCYAPFKGSTPPELKATLDIKKGAEGAGTTDVTWDPAQTGTPEAQALSQCLQGKLTQLGLTASSDEVKFPYTFRFINSRAGEAAAGLSPNLRFIQLDAMRGGTVADTAIAVGDRTNAATRYDALVKEYQKTKNWRMIDQLKSQCQKLLKADDAWAASLTKQLDVDQKTLALIQELKATDKQWGEAEAAATKQVEQTQADLATAQQTKKSDTGACPREK